MAQAGRIAAAPIGQSWLDQLAAQVGQASGPEGAEAQVDAWAESVAEDDRFAGLIYQTAFQTYLAGQLMVRSVELAEEADDGEEGTVVLSGSRAVEVMADSSAFLGMPFEEALTFFRSKALLSEAEFDALQDRYKNGGFIARRLASERLQEVARQSIARLLAQDMTLAEVTRAIRAAEAPEVQALGIAPAADHYLANVIRTNVATAYGHGRHEAMSDPAVVSLRPYRQFWTAGDSRVRPGHRALHSLVFEADGELAARYAPPLYYQCRCAMTTLSTRQFEKRGLEVTTERVAEIEAEGFWASAPSALAA